MSVSVRAANRTDRETCVRLLVAQLTEHNLPADPARVGDGVELAFNLLANQIVSVEKGGYTLWVEELYVVPAARRRQVATAFLEYLLTEGRRRGVRAVELEVLPTQTAAFALYRARGFHDVHRQRMTWDLS